MHPQEAGYNKSAYEVIRLGDLITLEYGTGLSESKREAGMYPVYGSNGIVGYHKMPAVKGPGIIVGRKGSIGEVTWSDSDFWPIDTSYYVVLKKDHVSLKWIYYLLPQLKLKDLNAATGIPGLNRNDAYSIKCLLPPERTQIKITSILLELDELIRKTDQIIEQTQRLKKGLMMKLMTKGIGHNRFKNVVLAYDLIEQIPNDWRIAKLNQLCKVVRGSSPRPAGDPKFFGGPVPWITVGELTKDNHMYLDSVSEGLTNEGRTRSRFLREGTVLLVNSGATLGIPKILRISGCINDGVAALLDLDKDVLAEYLYYILLSWVKLLRARNQGVFQLNINTSIIGDMNVPLPPITEQKNIVNFIYEMEKYNQHYLSYKNCLKVLKNGLMQNLLTGKIRVKL